MMKNIFKHQKGFTLAEVLITLGIIGVIAAFTIPVLVANSQKQEYVVGLKKSYSSLNQAFMRYAADMGCVGDLECTGLFSDSAGGNINKWNEFASNYLNVAKNCGTDRSLNCFPTEKLLNYSSGDADLLLIDGYLLILNDGTSVSIRVDNNCTGNTTGVDKSNLLYGTCAQLKIDVNGLKGPNTMGRDFFYLGITQFHGVTSYNGSKAYSSIYCGNENGCYWKTTNSVRNNCTTAEDSYGTGCVGRIIDEGWQMNY